MFVLEGVGALRTAYEVSRSRGLSRLVGRAEEMAALEAALARATDGAGGVVGVVGEAGVGKSRLCEEFAQACGARGLRVLRAHGVSHGRNLPLLPALQLLRQLFGITDADTPQETREKTAGRLLLHEVVEVSSDDLPLLFDVLEVPDPGRPVPRLAPEARLRRLFTLLRRVVQHRSERETLVILLEDLHWFDPASEEFLEMLVESYPGTRTLVLANFRPEFQAGWMRHSYYRQLPLAALGAGAIGELLVDLLGTDPSLARLPSMIVGRTGGNAFFVEEVVRTLIEEGTLEGTPGAYRLTGPLSELGVPATVQALLSARIDRLTARDKQVLQTAAVIGRIFSEPVLRQVTELSPDDLGSSLRSLCSAEFLQEEALYPVAEYRFWHPLTQEVAYGSLLGERRARIHGAVAGAIAELEPERADERAVLLAQHWEAAGKALEAVRWYARAANRSALRDLQGADRLGRATLRLLADVPESDETLALGITARTRLVRLAFRFGGDPRQSEAWADEARSAAERLEDAFGVVSAVYAKGLYLFGLGRLDSALGLLVDAARLAERIDDSEARAVRFLQVWVLSLRGPLALGLSYDDEMRLLATADPELGMGLLGNRILPYIVQCQAWLLARMGRLEDAARATEQAVTMARERSETDLVGFALPVHSLIAYLSGNGAGALGRAREVVALAGELGTPYHSVLAYQALGAASLVAGQAKDVLPALQDALALARDRHVALFEEAALLAYLADTYLLLGDADAAMRAAAEAVTVARTQGARVHGCQALVIHARVLRSVAGLDAAERVATALTEAGAAIEETGAHAWLPFLREEEARLALLAGDETRWEAQLREAHRLFAASGAAGHAARLGRELR